MASDNDELSLKINIEPDAAKLEELLSSVKKEKLGLNVEIDEKRLKELREEFNQLQAKAKETREKLKLNVSSDSSSSSDVNPKVGGGGYSSELIDILTKSEKTLSEMLKIQKKEYQKESLVTESEKEEEKKEEVQGYKRGIIPFVEDLAHSDIKTFIGGAVGGGIGALVGKPLAGAQLGIPAASIAASILESINSLLQGAAKIFDERLSEDLHFSQLSQQTGKSVDSLYRLSQQAHLATTSLQEIVNTNQKWADELMTGISQDKAQLLMALNINPEQVLAEKGGDYEKFTQEIFERTEKATQYMNPYQRTSILQREGFSPQEQYAREKLYRKDTQQATNEVVKAATAGGKIPLQNPDQIYKQNLGFNTEKLKIAASERALATTNAAEKAAIGVMRLEAETVNITTKGTIYITGGGLAHDFMHGNLNEQQRREQNERTRGLFGDPRVPHSPLNQPVKSKNPNTQYPAQQNRMNNPIHKVTNPASNSGAVNSSSPG